MVEILKKNKRREVENILEKNYGLRIPFKYHLIKTGKDKIRIFTSHLNAQDIRILDKILTVDTIGLYFAFFKDSELRLSFDFSTFVGKKSKIVLSLSESEAKKWLKGQDLDKKTRFKGYVLVKYDSDILGCGKATKNKILNFVPKERRIL